MASRRWRKDPITGAKVKSVLPLDEASAAELPTDKPELIRSNGFNSILPFKTALKQAITYSSGKKTLSILRFSQEWLPSAEAFQCAFSIVFQKHHLGKGILDLFLDLDLVHGYYGKYVILSSGTKPFEFYTSAIDFFLRFRPVMTNAKSQELAVLRELGTDSANPTFLLFSSPRGKGLLVKSLEDKEYSGGANMELDILRIANILGVNVPKNAVVVHNTRSQMYRAFARNGEILVESLTPVSTTLASATPEMLSQIMTYDGENLGRMFVFDVVTGSWDRHAWNYLVTTVNRRQSLQEIDFGLFQPDFYKPPKFREENDSRQPYPSKYPERPGWGIVRHPKVTTLMQQANQRLFAKGINYAIKKLYEAVTAEAWPRLVSLRLQKRARDLFVEGRPTHELFIQELEQLGIETDLFRLLLAELRLTR